MTTPTDVIAIFTLLLAAVIGFVLAANAAPADYCRLYAREYSRLVVVELEPIDRATVTIDALEFMLNQRYAKCLNADDPPQLPLQREASDVEYLRWLTKVARLQLLPEPVPQEPAAEEPPTPKPNAKAKAQADTAEWKKWCRANYRSFNPKTGMVNSRSRGHIRCPGPRSR